MASSKEFLTFVLDQFSLAGEIKSRAMMGEYLLYYKGVYFAAVCDDRLLLKPTPAGEALLPGAAMEAPYEGAKPMILVEELEDRELLARLAEETAGMLLAAPQKGKAKRKKRDEE